MTNAPMTLKLIPWIIKSSTLSRFLCKATLVSNHHGVGARLRDKSPSGPRGSRAW